MVKKQDCINIDSKRSAALPEWPGDSPCCGVKYPLWTQGAWHCWGDQVEDPEGQGSHEKLYPGSLIELPEKGGLLLLLALLGRAHLASTRLPKSFA